MFESSGEMTPPCGVPAIVARPLPLLHHACREPLPQQLQHPPIRDAPRHQLQQLRCGRCCRSSRGCRRPARGCRRARRARAAFPAPASRCASAESHTTRRRKSASKIGSSTSVAAICATRSRTVGMPSGRCRPSAFGMYRRRTGCGRYVPARSAAPSSSSMRSTPYCSTAASVSRSTPAAPRFRFTRRHASCRTSRLQIRSIRAWKRRSGDRLAATQSRRCNWRTLSMGGRPPG